MSNNACLDTGVITQYYAKDVPPEIKKLMNSIKSGKIRAHVLTPILVEVYYNICKLKGKEVAQNQIASFFYEIPFKLVSLDKSLILKAGILKCQYRKQLSYNDCYAIAYALNNNMTFHTTEKELKKILPNLKVKEYRF
ncbi:MAG: type II toxin-antitoxin system VapC family toxin [Promethearchaeia archaeon]